jgi:hypothetical protein
LTRRLCAVPWRPNVAKMRSATWSDPRFRNVVTREGTLERASGPSGSFHPRRLVEGDDLNSGQDAQPRYGEAGRQAGLEVFGSDERDIMSEEALSDEGTEEKDVSGERRAAGSAALQGHPHARVVGSGTDRRMILERLGVVQMNKTEILRMVLAPLAVHDLRLAPRLERERRARRRVLGNERRRLVVVDLPGAPVRQRNAESESKRVVTKERAWLVRKLVERRLRSRIWHGGGRNFGARARPEAERAREDARTTKV